MQWLSSGGLVEARFFIGLASSRFLLGLASGRFSLCARTYLRVVFKHLTGAVIGLFFNTYRGRLEQRLSLMLLRINSNKPLAAPGAIASHSQ